MNATYSFTDGFFFFPLFYFCCSNGIFVNPQDGSELSCAALEAVALGGAISETNCGFLPSFVTDCGCQPVGTSSNNNTDPAPAPAPAPEPAPTPATEAPVAPTGEFPPCNVCGEGMEVGNP
jgi:hypothetical protein